MASAEEVAQLAQAIHSHADVLAEHWKRGPPRMARMEDTFELLADPELTPRLEHLVSSFVRRDRAKRQLGDPPLEQQEQPQQFVHHHHHNPYGQSSLPSSPSSPPVVTQIPIIQTGSSGIGMGTSSNAMPAPVSNTLNGATGSGGQPAKKHLPRSILAAVQRFEQPGPQGPSSTLTINNQYHGVAPAPEPMPVTSTSIPGIGPISRNLLWAESNGRSTVTERSLGRTILNPVSLDSGAGGSAPRRVVHIPIERVDESGGVTRVLNTSKVETIKNTVTCNNPGEFMRQPQQPIHNGFIGSAPGEKIVPIRLIDECVKDPEEDRLFHSLRSGMAGFERDQRSASPAAAASVGSRVAFAKERIRQSQEHPLTQQRLELQKRLPAPSSSLAAAIALQQGKNKFGPSSEVVDLHLQHHDHHEDENKDPHGRQWVSSMLRFNNGASVADRVQLFEKYPAHIVNTHHSQQSTSAATAQTIIHSPGEVLERPSRAARLQQVESPSQSVLQEPFGRYNTSPRSITATASNPSRHVYEADPLDLQVPTVGVHQVRTPSPTSSDGLRSGTTSPVVAPWRNIPIENSREHNDEPDGSQKLLRQQPIFLARNTNNNNNNALRPSGGSSAILLSSSPPKSKSPTNNRFLSSVPSIPRFYFPDGKPGGSCEADQQQLQLGLALLQGTAANFLHYEDLGRILQSLDVPLYWKKGIWDFLGVKKDQVVKGRRLEALYKALWSQCPDDEARFLTIMQSGESRKKCSRPAAHEMDFRFFNFSKMYITMSDFIPMMQDIIDTHPGLGFLRDAPEFHSRYITTVISRIFYKVNRSWSGRITWQELKRSNLLRIIKRLEQETDINAITEYFSYEHFYVIYCKFWELDKDHDLLIDREDLAAHSDYALSRRIVDRIFDGTVLRGWDVSSPVKSTCGKMTYSDFVWFLLSEEDKKTPTAIEYWFRCLDLDGDGIISLFELEYFYEEQQQRIEALHIEPVHFANIICCFMDMLHCSAPGIRLKDLRRNSQLASVIFNTMFNLDKYLEHEQRDPFSSTSTGNVGANGEWQEGDSDWDKFAAAEYESLIAEESPSDHLHDTPDYDDPGYFNLTLA